MINVTWTWCLQSNCTRSTELLILKPHIRQNSICYAVTFVWNNCVKICVKSVGSLTDPINAIQNNRAIIAVYIYKSMSAQLIYESLDVNLLILLEHYRRRLLYVRILWSVHPRRLCNLYNLLGPSGCMFCFAHCTSCIGLVCCPATANSSNCSLEK